MRTPTAALVSGCAALLALLGPGRARADELPTFEIAGKVGYLSNSQTIGLGGRVGYAFSSFYAGLSLVDYPGLQPGLVNEVAAEAELGYGLRFAFITLRPLVGLGAGFGDSPPCYPSMAPLQKICSGSSESFLVQPGGLVQLGFGHVIFGASGSALISIGSAVGTGFEVDGQVGARF
jgi:hypothetical protein